MASARRSAATLEGELSTLSAQAHQMLSRLPEQDQGLMRLEHSTAEMIDITQNLQKANRGTNTAVQKTNAQLLHSSGGMDVASYQRRLEELRIQSLATPQPRFGETSVDHYLQSQRDEALSMAIDDTMHATRDEYLKQHESHLQRDWEEEKKALREMLASNAPIQAVQTMPMTSATYGSAFDGGSSMFGAPATPFSAATGFGGGGGGGGPPGAFGHGMLATPGATGTAASLLDTDAQAYARVVWWWVSHVMEDRKFKLLEEFLRETESLKTPEKAQIYRAWEVLARMCAIPGIGADGFDPLSPDLTEQKKPSESRDVWRHYETNLAAGFGDPVEGLQQQWIRNAREHLQTKFWHDHVQEKIVVRDDEPWYVTYVRECENDSDPGLFKLPGGGEASNEERQWLHVYVCLRAGQLEDAANVLMGVRECRENTPHQTELMQRLKGYSDSDFSKSSGKYPGSAKDFMQRPYKTLVYQVLGMSAPDAKSRQFRVIDEWLWFRLNTVFRDPTTDPKLAYRQLQDELWETPSRAEMNHLVYFEVLLLTAQFDRAIAFLLSERRLKLAVHFAIPLEHYGLLNCAAYQIPRSATERENAARALGLGGMDIGGYGSVVADSLTDFGHLVCSYVRTFQHSNIPEAMRYYYLLRLYKASASRQGASDSTTTIVEESLFVHSVTDMAIRTEEYPIILGRFAGSSGVKEEGLVDTFEAAWENEEKNYGRVLKGREGMGKGKRQIIRAVANHQELQGSDPLNAIELYDLSEDREKVLELLCFQLSVLASREQAYSNPGSLNIIHKAERVESSPRYRTMTERSMRELRAMLTIVTFFRMIYESSEPSNLHGALNVLKQLKGQRPFAYFPVDGNQTASEDAVRAFEDIPECVLRNLPQLLLCSMQCLKICFDNGGGGIVQAGGFIDSGGKSDTLREYREHAEALVQFAGRIVYRMPGDTNAKLVQLSATMRM